MSDDYSVKIQQMIDRQEIQDVLLRYCRGVDRGDVEMIRSAYHADAIDDHGIWKGPGVDFASWIVDMLKDSRQTMHMIGNSSIELDGNVAYGETYCLSVHDGGKDHQAVYNRYVDRFEKRDGKWAIASRKVVFDISHNIPAGVPYGKDLSEPLTWGRRDKLDPSYRP